MNTLFPIPRRLFVAVTFLALFTHAANAVTWKIETVDTNVVGKFSSIAMDPAGTIHISYYDGRNGNVKYAAYSGGAWHIEIVASVGAASLWAFTAITVNLAGVPHIAFYDDNQDALKLAVRVGSAWSIETIDVQGIIAFFPSIALDASGNTHVSYLFMQGSSISGKLRYAVKSGTSWSVETVDKDGDTGYYTSIAVEGSGQPHISYIRYPSPGDKSSSILKYTTRSATGGSWTIDDVDLTVPKAYTGIALDASSVPHISYHDWDNGYLMYGIRSGGTWTTGFVDETANVGRFSSIAINSSGTPHIAYYDITNKYLKYATLGTQGWSTEVVDASSSVGSYCDIALDPSGIPHISYYDATFPLALKHAAMLQGPMFPPQDGEVVTINPPEFPYKVTAEIKCTESILGLCLRKELRRICIGPNCFDVPKLKPPCVRCYLALSGVIGLAAGAIGQIYLRRRKRSQSGQMFPKS